MPNDKYPSIEYLRQCFEYRNGKLYWTERPIDHFDTMEEAADAYRKAAEKLFGEFSFTEELKE